MSLLNSSGFKRLVKTFLTILLFFANISFANAVSLTDLLRENERKLVEKNETEKKAQITQKKADELKNVLDQISSGIKGTESKIQQTHEEISKTGHEIDSTKQSIEKKQKELETLRSQQNEAIRTLYAVGTETDTMEILLKSKNFSDVIEQNNYLESLETRIEVTIAEVEGLKADLEGKKSNLEKQQSELQSLKNQQEEQKKSLENQQSYKSQLLDLTEQQKESYLRQAEKLKSEIAQISAEIYAERQRLLRQNNESIFSGGSGYPYSAIDVADPWLFLTRECTSYAAWYWNVKLGKNWYNTQPGRGHASYWDEIARTLGYTVSSSPRVGAIISWKASSVIPYGHVAIVEGINDNGTIDISEFNWVKYAYSYRSNVNPGTYGSYSYIY